MRRRLEADAPARLNPKMWLFPWLTYIAIAAMVAVIASMALVEDVRPQLIPSFSTRGLAVARPARAPRGAGPRKRGADGCRRRDAPGAPLGDRCVRPTAR